MKWSKPPTKYVFWWFFLEPNRGKDPHVQTFWKEKPTKQETLQLTWWLHTRKVIWVHWPLLSITIYPQNVQVGQPRLLWSYLARLEKEITPIMQID